MCVKYSTICVRRRNVGAAGGQNGELFVVKRMSARVAEVEQRAQTPNVRCGPRQRVVAHQHLWRLRARTAYYC